MENMMTADEWFDQLDKDATIHEFQSCVDTVKVETLKIADNLIMFNISKANANNLAEAVV